MAVLGDLQDGFLANPLLPGGNLRFAKLAGALLAECPSQVEPLAEVGNDGDLEAVRGLRMGREERHDTAAYGKVCEASIAVLYIESATWSFALPVVVESQALWLQEHEMGPCQTRETAEKQTQSEDESGGHLRPAMLDMPLLLGCASVDIGPRLLVPRDFLLDFGA